MEQELHLALITNDHFRAEALSQAAAGFQWRVQPIVGQAQPLGWLRRTQADIAVVDLDVPNAISLVRDIVAALPHLSVLVLATPQHLVDLQEALVAGAASFIAFPIDPTQFTTTVMRMMQEGTKREVRVKRGRLVAVAGLKGGVGRTTLAVNLAVALRQRVDGEVILAEAHHGLSDLALNLNLLPRHTVAHLAQESNLDTDVIQGHLQAHASRIKVLAAPAELSQVVELPAEMWRAILTHLLEAAPYVVIDTAAVIDAVLSEVLTLADDVVVVTGPDLAALRSAVVLLKSLDEEAEVHARTHVVLNRAGIRGGVDEAACVKQLGENITVALPDDPSLATFALNRGVPYVLSHPRAILSRKVQELTGAIFELGATPKPPRTKAQGGGWGFGKRRTVQQAIGAVN